MKYSIVHLVDDSAVAGVARNIDFLVNSAEVAHAGSHKVVSVRRGQINAPKLNADIIVSHLSVCWANLPFFAALRAAYPRTPLVHVEHTHTERYVALNVKNTNRFETLFRSVMAVFDQVVAVSEGQAQWMRRKGYCPGGRLSVIEPCSDLAPFLATFPRASRAPRVVAAIGAIETRAGFDILVEAFQDEALAHLELHIHGEGSQLKALKAMARGRGNIVFKGPVADQAAAVAACDVVAMPSRWDAGGVEAVEAMAASRPVICAPCDGAAVHLDGGAIDVGQNTPGSWVEVLSHLADRDLNAIRADSRLHAQTVRKQHAQAWVELIYSAIGASEGEKLAA